MGLVLIEFCHCANSRDIGFRAPCAARAILVVADGVGDLHLGVGCDRAQCDGSNSSEQPMGLTARCSGVSQKGSGQGA